MAAAAARGWTVTIFDKRDKRLCEKECATLAEVAALFGRGKACDLGHLIDRVSDDEKRRRQMLQRWKVWFTLERKVGQMDISGQRPANTSDESVVAGD